MKQLTEKLRLVSQVNLRNVDASDGSSTYSSFPLHDLNRSYHGVDIYS